LKLFAGQAVHRRRRDSPGAQHRDNDVLRNISLAALLLMALALLGLLFRGALFSSQPVAIMVEVLAVALMVWARLTFGQRSFHAAANPSAGGLVTTGPYRYIRHPIYTAACLFGWSGVLANISLINVMLGVLLLVGAVVRMLCEERLIVADHPEYAAYARTTRRMVPFIY
jgi:protein-S-isoprenylcysteine O-methyltransferase Ste14